MLLLALEGHRNHLTNRGVHRSTGGLIDGDLTRLAQIISNLVINGAKYTGAGGQIQLSVLEETDDVVVKVKDGIGIADLPLRGDPNCHAASPARGEVDLAAVEKCRILVVDDSHDSADSLVLVLQSNGHEVHTAYEGEKAILWRNNFALMLH
jgi:hypothetical protein